MTAVGYKYRRELARQLLLCQQSILSYYITTVSTYSTDKRLLNPLTESADVQHIVLAGHVRHQTCYIVNEKGIDRLSDTERSKQMLNKALSLGTTPRGGFRSDQS